MLALSFATLDLLSVKIASLFSDSAPEQIFSQVGTFSKPLLEDVRGKKDEELALPVNANLGRAIKQAENLPVHLSIPHTLPKPKLSTTKQVYGNITPVTWKG